MTFAVEHRCRHCQKVRTPPIEGPCPHCGGYYRTMVRRPRTSDPDELPEEVPVSASALLRRHGDNPALLRRPTGLAGVDHVFDGGLPASGTILLSGKEGAGKTSWLWNLFLALAAQRVRALYLSSEQSQKDLIAQFRRFGEDRIEAAGAHLKIAAQKDYLGLLDLIESRKSVKAVAVDSLHLIEGVLDDHDQPLRSGSAGAVERLARDIKELSKRGFLAFLVGHMNNDGTMAGGAHLRHVVDATLGLHRMTDHLRDPRRVLRFETKTRFGEMGREALYKMARDGFQDCGPILDEEEDEDPPLARTPRKSRLVN